MWNVDVELISDWLVALDRSSREQVVAAISCWPSTDHLWGGRLWIRSLVRGIRT